ncbi:MAG: polyketide cyclase [Lachnospiraceae bacterium]|nr:polyketide cyclase [Lachnospiraceae bacterium]
MAVSNLRVMFPFPVETMWDLITSREDYSWRSNLNRIEILNENQFVEYTKEGDVTTVTVREEMKYRKWELDMENKDINGRWTCMLYSWGDSTEICITEEINPKKLYLMPFVPAYLEERRVTYMKDLTRVLVYRRNIKNGLTMRTTKGKGRI